MTDEQGGSQASPAATGGGRPPAPMTAKQKRSQLIRSGLGLVATAIIIWFVVKWFQSQGASISQVWIDLRHMPTWAVIALAGATVFNLFVYPTPYQASTFGLRYPAAFTVRQTSFTISNVIPFGGTIGLGVQYGMFGTYDIEGTAIVSTLTISSVWTELMTLGLPVLGIIGVTLTGQATSQQVTLALVGLVGVALIVAALVLVLRSVKGAERVGGWLAAAARPIFKMLKKPAPDVTASVLKFRSDTSAVISKRWLSITLTNILVQLGMFSVLYAALVGLTASTGGAKVTLIEAFAAFAFSRIGTLVPVPGGLGTTDAILVASLQAYGATATVATGADITWRICYYAVQVVAGLLSFMWWQYVVRRRKAHAAA